MKDRILLDAMPFDRAFENEDGESVNCHATGYAVQFDGETTQLGAPLYWTEYTDADGNLYYGN